MKDDFDFQMYIDELNSLPFPSLPFYSLPFPSIPLPSLPLPSLPPFLVEVCRHLGSDYRGLFSKLDIMKA